MNAKIARFYVLANEVITIVMIAAMAILLVSSAMVYGLKGLIGALITCLLIIMIMGISAIFIENHKLLMRIASKNRSNPVM